MVDGIPSITAGTEVTPVRLKELEETKEIVENEEAKAIKTEEDADGEVDVEDSGDSDNVSVLQNLIAMLKDLIASLITQLKADKTDNKTDTTENTGTTEEAPPTTDTPEEPATKGEDYEKQQAYIRMYKDDIKEKIAKERIDYDKRIKKFFGRHAVERQLEKELEKVTDQDIQDYVTLHWDRIKKTL